MAQWRVEEKVKELGYPQPDFPFHPHITLGRFPREWADDDADRTRLIIKDWSPPEPVEWTVGGFCCILLGRLCHAKHVTLLTALADGHSIALHGWRYGGNMGSSIALDCLNCGESFQAVRITAKYCGGTCRQQFNRQANGLAKGPAENLKIKVEISRVAAVVKSLRKKFSLEDLIISDLTGELQDAFDSLDEVVNPLCEQCEKPADGWDEILLCRRCEITHHDMYCGSCETRRPSVKSDNAFCLKCENGES